MTVIRTLNCSGRRPKIVGDVRLDAARVEVDRVLELFYTPYSVDALPEVVSAERTIESRDALTPSAGARTVREILGSVRVDHHIEVACKPQSNRVVVCVLCGQTIASAIAMCPSKPTSFAMAR